MNTQRVKDNVERNHHTSLEDVYLNVGGQKIAIPPDTRKLLLAKALSLSGETDEVCDECKGEGEIFHYGVIDTLKAWSRCLPCKGTGVIKHKWHIEVVETKPT